MSTAKFVTKRAHKKSRQGCSTCKAKKVKCDEVRPKCGYCELRCLKCDYAISLPIRSPVTTDSPTSSNDTDEDTSTAMTVSRYDGEIITTAALEQLGSLSKWTLLPGCGDIKSSELYMMHHYSTYAINNLACGEGPQAVMRYVLPSMAFESDFLMNALFGLAARHRRILSPDNEEVQQQFLAYRTKAVAIYSKSLPSALTPTGKPVSMESFESLVLMSLMVVILFSSDVSTVDNLMILQILRLYRGLHLVMMAQPGFGALVAKTSRIAPLFQRDPNEIYLPPALPNSLLTMLTGITPSDPDAPHLDTLCAVLDDLGTLYACLRQEGRSACLGQRMQSWLSRPKIVFVTLASEMKPRALIILAYFLCFVKMFDLWWLEGRANQDIPLISQILGADWEVYLETPMRVVELTDGDEIMELMLAG